MVQPNLNALKDRTIAITRSRRDADEFFNMVNAEGGTAIALPTIHVVPKGEKAAADFLDKLKREFDYCAFMSSQAVDVLFSHAPRKETIAALNKLQVIAVGPKTRARLEANGVRVGLVPNRFSSAGLVELLAGRQPEGKKIIIPRSAAANDFAAKALAGLGMKVEQVFLYTVKTSAPGEGWQTFATLLAKKEVDGIVFTSASSVRAFFEILGRMPQNRQRLDRLTKVISIGPFTSRELKKRRIEYLEAGEHTVKGTLELARRVIGTLE
jgi:uroporphyrinogen-III synthase